MKIDNIILDSDIDRLTIDIKNKIIERFFNEMIEKKSIEIIELRNEIKRRIIKWVI